MNETGTIVSVQQEPVGSVLAADATTGDGTITVQDASDFDEISGGTLLLGGTTYDYTAVDMESGVITLTGTLAADADESDRVDVYDTALGEAAVETRAMVAVPGAQANDDSLDAAIAQALATTLELGIRDPGAGESVTLERRGDEWTVTDVKGKKPKIQPDYVPSSGGGPVAIAYYEAPSPVISWNDFSDPPSTTYGDVSCFTYDSGSGGIVATVDGVYSGWAMGQLNLFGTDPGARLTLTATDYAFLVDETFKDDAPTMTVQGPVFPMAAGALFEVKLEVFTGSSGSDTADLCNLLLVRWA